MAAIRQGVRNCINVYKKTPKSSHCEQCVSLACDICPIKKYFPKRKLRVCLCCNKKFLSQGSFNRRCSKCEQDLESTDVRDSRNYVNFFRI